MLKLIDPAGYYDIPKEERDTWGCGPGGFGDVLVPDTVYGLSVNAACRRHDFRYRFRDPKTEKTRKLDDQEFLYNMQAIVLNSTKNWLMRRLRLTRCRTMYHAVRWFGKGAYYG